MGYEFDFYVSYRRSDPDWTRWTRENFVRVLRLLLLPVLGHVSFFLDDYIETGSDWPTNLWRALASSKLLIPILSRSYFQSSWCRWELATMLHREKLLGLRSPAAPYGLVLPFVIDDGDSFPLEVRQIQSIGIHEFANPFMRVDSPRQEAFAERIRVAVPSIATAFENVPAFDPEWVNIGTDVSPEALRIQESLRIQTESIRSVPRLVL